MDACGMVDASYTNARVRGLRGRLIEPQRLLDLAQAKSVEDFLNNLSSSDYSQELKDVSEEDVYSIEAALLANLASRESLVLSSTPAHLTDFISARISRNEITVLKDLVQAKCGGEKTAGGRDYSFLLSGLLRKLHSQLIDADMSEFMELLEGTRYYESLKSVHGTEGGTRNPLAYNAVLDRIYFTDLLRKAEELPASDRVLALPPVRREVDYANTLVYLRAKSLGLAYTLFYIPDGGSVNHAKELEHRINAEEPFSTYVKKNDVFGLELSLRRGVFISNKKVFLSGSDGVDTVLAYLALKETEVQNLWTIASGILGKLSSDRIKAILVV